MKSFSVQFLVILSLLLSLNLNAQDKEAYMQGMKAFNRNNFPGAITKFKEAINYNQRYADAWYFIGLAFAYSEQFEDAAYSFTSLESINPEYNPQLYYEASKAFIELDKFKEAEEYILKYQQRIPDDPRNTMTQHMVKNRVNYAKISPIIRDLPNSMSDPIPLDAVNSSTNDYTPQVSPTGTLLYFTSVRKGGYDNMDDESKPNDWGEDVYFSSLQNDQWSSPQLMPEPINSLGDDFGSAFTGDGQIMVYVRCGQHESVGSCDLYMTQLQGTSWAEPANMGNVVNSESWDSQPTMNSDGNKIIFTSARDGGYGGMDLYMTEKNHLGDWGIPQNLGSTVNTPLNDNSPYLAPDGKTLYYSSEGHPGFGGTDVFYTVFDNGKWSKPINLGAPLNSKGDDTNFSISATGIAYFASSRLDADNYDIFQIELPDRLKPKPTVVIQGIVSNAETKDPLQAVVLIEDINSGEIIALNKSNSATGEYLVVLLAGRDYSVSANNEGFFFYSRSFELPKDTSYSEITMNIDLEPIKKGTKVVLNNIFFESGRAELKPISYVELGKAVDLLKDNPTMVVEVGGHTDNVGSEALNLKLSQNRANAVMQYLTLAGIESSRLKAKGYGESQPIADNTTKEGKAANRRTEFTIVEF